ncbi:MAG TPA: TRAP transporter small permease subunit [Microvirga sp.]|jgi:TRAP-type C4-dicarboxylate transport system permease small subunit|nr:TRAP transporter small permease subunit [Microvirga sp.]
MSRLYHLSNGIAFVERWLCRGLILGFTVLLVTNAALRYGAGRPLYFAEELAVLVLVWMGFLAISLSLHRGDQVRVTLLTDHLKPRAAALVETAVQGLMAVILAALLWSAVGWIGSPAVEFERAIALDLPKAPLFAIIPIFCATALIHTLAKLVKAASPLAGRPQGAQALETAL